jgi:RNA polymerase sigma-54 factor
MALSHKLELRQGQQLAMTPQLQQAIRLLQYSNIELNAFVETELERNPLLERDEAEAIEQGRTIDSYVEPTVPSLADGNADAALDFSRGQGTAENPLDTDYDNVFPDSAPSELTAESPGAGSLSS